MDPSPQNEAQLFHAYLSQQIAVGTSQSPEALLSQWRSEQEDFDDAVEAIREGLADLEAGRVRPWEQFDGELRERYNLPARGE